MKQIFYKFPNLSLILLFLAVLLAGFSGCGPATDTSLNSNLSPKETEDSATGGFVWGRNDPKTGEHQEEKSDKEIIKRQEEVIRRQEEDKARLEREKQDVLRQKYHNELMKVR